MLSVGPEPANALTAPATTNRLVHRATDPREPEQRERRDQLHRHSWPNGEDAVA